MHAELEELDRQLEAAARDADAVATGLSEGQAAWRAHPGSWTVAQCIDHLATTNRVYLDAMNPAATEARAQNRVRRGPARPGLFGRWFVRYLEPPAGMKTKAPKQIEPSPSPLLANALPAFHATQDELRTFLRNNADLDLAGVQFPNPFVRGLRISLATALHATAAHERRHIWQAWNIRRLSGSGGAGGGGTRS